MQGIKNQNIFFYSRHILILNVKVNLSRRMFTFLFCFMFVTVAFSLACNEDSWFQKKTREAKDLCYGNVRSLTTLLARVLGVATGGMCVPEASEGS